MTSTINLPTGQSSSSYCSTALRQWAPVNITHGWDELKAERVLLVLELKMDFSGFCHPQWGDGETEHYNFSPELNQWWTPIHLLVALFSLRNPLILLKYWNGKPVNWQMKWSEHAKFHTLSGKHLYFCMAPLPWVQHPQDKTREQSQQITSAYIVWQNILPMWLIYTGKGANSYFLYILA